MHELAVVEAICLLIVAGDLWLSVRCLNLQVP